MDLGLSELEVVELIDNDDMVAETRRMAEMEDRRKHMDDRQAQAQQWK